MKGAEFFPYGVIEPAKNIEITDRILDEYFGISKLLGIKSYLGFGTCLGLYRDKGYIEGDNDLDVIAVVSSAKEVIGLIDALRRNEFIKGFSHPMPMNNTHFHKNKILLDVYFRSEGGYYQGEDELMYKDKKYPIPHLVEEYLSKCYTDWKVKADETSRYTG